ncbi:MAG: hypothetical protein AAGL90_00540 [Pseudomonadota bacterium]
MSNATFETFMVSGLLVLIAAIVYLAWSAWRWVDRERDMEKRALNGIGYEMRVNLERMLSELAGVANGTLKSEIDLVPVIHPQLDALLARPNEVNRRGLTILRDNYNQLSAHKQSMRAALVARENPDASAHVATRAVIGSIATLYLWDEHDARPPDSARSTRSWHVRDWMKAKGFKADSLPGLHLRDQVVEYLRQAGMVLTPKPLTHTAHEFYSMQYDRKADPNAPFWKRRQAKQDVSESAEASELEADPDPDPDPVPADAPHPQENLSPDNATDAPETTGAADEAAAESALETEDTVETKAESEPETKPQSSGSTV